jgi:pantothenate kinase
MSNPLKPIYVSLNTYELIKELAKKEDRSIRSWMDIAIGDIYEQKSYEEPDRDDDLFA